MMAPRPCLQAVPRVGLVCLLLLTACARDSDTTAVDATASGPNEAIRDNRAVVDSFYQSIDYDMNANPVAQASEAFISNPFAKIASLAEATSLSPYVRQISGPVRRASRPEPNRHDSTQIDSLVTLYFEGGSRVQFYRKSDTGEFLLLSADIRSPRCQLQNGIHVGMTEQQLVAQLQSFMLVRTHMPGRIELEHPTVSSQLIFHLMEPDQATEADQLFVARIEYMGYVD